MSSLKSTDTPPVDSVIEPVAQTSNNTLKYSSKPESASTTAPSSPVNDS